MTIRKLLNYWLGKKRSGFYLSLGTLSAAAYAAGNIIQSPKSLSLMMKPAGFLSFLVTILAFFIHLNLHAAYWFLNHFKDVDRLPKKQVAFVNSVSMTVFTGLAAATLPGAAFLLEPLWQLAGRWLSGRMSLDQAVYPALYMQSQPLESPDFSALLADARPTAPWISLLDKIFRTAGAFLLLFLTVLAVRILFLRIWAWIIKPRHFDSDEKIYLTPVWPPSLAGKLLLNKKGKGFRLSYDEKIRQNGNSPLPCPQLLLSWNNLWNFVSQSYISFMKKPDTAKADAPNQTGRFYLRLKTFSCPKIGSILRIPLSYRRSLNLCTDSDSSSDWLRSS